MKLIKFLFLLVLSMFLINSVSAFNPDGGWNDTVQTNITIDNGDSIDFWVYIITSNPPMNIDVKLYDSDSDLIHTFENSRNVDDYYFMQTYDIDQSIYQTTGDFEVVISGSDTWESNSHTLTLTVNEVVLPENNPPVITSTPITEIDEGADYSYQVTATDADGDDLSYSLTQDHGWLSIDFATGLITGTAPSVDSDTNYTVSVLVTDGEDIDTQTYDLTVQNLITDTTNPVITITHPIDNNTYNSPVSSIVFEITDPNLNSCWYSLDGGLTNQSLNCTAGFVNGFISVEGENNWVVYANDTFDNEAVFTITFYVDLSVSDTTSPIITLVGADTQNITIGDAYVELGATALDDIDGDITDNIIINDSAVDTNTLGFYMVTYNVVDSSGNSAIEVTRTVNVVDLPEEEEDEDDEDQGGINFFEENPEEAEYLSQFEYIPPIIDLTEDTPADKLSLLEKVWQAIVDFFKNLFGF